MSDFQMAPQNVQDDRTRFFYEYSRRYAEAKTLKIQRHQQRNGGSSSPPPAVPTNVFPRKYLMHSLRCLKMAPTEEELEAAEQDVFNAKDSIVTLDQFLEICDSVRCVATDVDKQDVLQNFRSALLLSASDSVFSPSPQQASPGHTPSLAEASSGLTANNLSHTNFDFYGTNGAGGPQGAASSSLLVPREGSQHHHSGHTSAAGSPPLSVVNRVPPLQQQRRQSSVSGAGDSPSKAKRRKYVTREEMREVLSGMTDAEFEAAMECADPNNTNQIDIESVAAILSGGLGSCEEVDDEESDESEKENDSNAASGNNKHEGAAAANAVNAHPKTAAAEEARQQSDSGSSNRSSEGGRVNNAPTDDEEAAKKRRTSTSENGPDGEGGKATTAVSDANSPVHAEADGNGREQRKAGGGKSCCGSDGGCVIQ